MKTIKSSFTTLMFISLIINVSISHANQSREEQIKALTQEIYQKEDEIAAKSAQFIADLKEKYPHFNDEQLDSMRLTFEESLLDSTNYTPKHKKHKSADTTSETETTLSKEARQGKVSQLVKSSKEKEQQEADKEVIKEADITVVSLTVKQGDTLGDIAQRTYGDSSMYIAIYEENKDQLSSPNKIPEGIILRVPKIDNSMQSKFSKLVQETQHESEKISKKPAKDQPKLVDDTETKKRNETTNENSQSTQPSPDELNRLIFDAVSKSIKD